MEVRAKNKATRVEIPGPREIVVNDGSVPESNLTNNRSRLRPKEVRNFHHRDKSTEKHRKRNATTRRLQFQTLGS